MSPPRYRLGPMPEPIPEALRRRGAQIEIATVGHFRHRGFVRRTVLPVWAVRGTIVGTAVTLAIPGPDSTLLHHALGLLRPGDVLVVDRLGDDRHAAVGGGVAFAAKQAGAAAIVLDGPCTDPHEIAEVGLPVWAAGVASITTRILDLGGALNQPIACGGVPVHAGDLVLADATGVLVLPPDEAEAAIDEAVAREARGTQRRAQVAAGARLGDLSGATAKILAALEQG